MNPLAGCNQLTFVRELSLNFRRPCRLMGMSQATPSRKQRLLVKDAPVIAAMKELSALYPRYDHRRIRAFLSR
jgi:putative transposase